MKTIFFLTIVSFLITSLTISQVGPAVPFITISPSAEANGMGGISGAIQTPSSVYFNPANLGTLSQTIQAGTEFYLQRSEWEKLKYNHYAFVFGVKLVDETKNKLTLGAAYSRTILDFDDRTYPPQWWTQEFAGSTNTEAAGLDIYESSDNFSVGAAYNFGILVSSGITVKQIASHLGGSSSINGVTTYTAYTAKPTAVDLGLALKFPLVNLISFIVDSSELYLSYADAGISYAINNWGQEVVYADPAQAEPLPRIARLGWLFEAGYNYSFDDFAINLIGVAFAREAEARLLITTERTTIAVFH